MIDYQITQQVELTKKVNEAKEKPLETTDCREQGAEMTKQYIPQLLSAFEEGKKNYKEDFFVVCMHKRDGYFQNVIRKVFIIRLTCPSPDYNQSVFMYDKKKDAIEFLWCIPSRRMALDLLENMNIADQEHVELIKNILDFRDGTLMKKAKKLNREDVLIGNALIEVQDGQ
jgi:hypothetical protein